MKIRRQSTLRYCNRCKITTMQTRMNCDNIWRCRVCGLEIPDDGIRKRTPREE